MRILKSIAILLFPLKVMACGLDWSEPVSHFPNVDFQGNVHVVRKLGEAEKLPIYLIFNSSYGISPYAGPEFELPLLESRMWQVDENRFQMKAPSGWLWIFQRTKVPNVVEGNAGWKGLIKDDTITVWAPCGDKITFKNGKIVSMQLKDEKFDYAYKGNRVESIQMNGRTILEVKSDDKTGDVTGIEIPSAREHIAFQQTGSRPKTETAGGMNVVSRVDKALSEVTKSDGSKETFEFGVDDEMNPIVNIGGSTLSWNSVTKHVVKDGEWVYNINSGVGLFDNASIERENARHQKESWHYDAFKGQEYVLLADGSRFYTFWHVSGIAVGRVRLIRVARGTGNPIVYYQASYDELGRVKREIRGNLSLAYKYEGNSPRHSTYEVYRNGRFISSQSTDLQTNNILSNN